jgi:hypothetical protein
MSQVAVVRRMSPARRTVIFFILLAVFIGGPSL